MKPKVIFIKNRMVDYIIPWLNIIAKEIDLKMLFVRDYKTDIRKQFSNINFNYETAHHFKVLGKYGISLPGVFRLLFERYDVVVSSDLHTFEAITAFFIAKVRGKKYIPWVETFEWPRAPRSRLLQPFIRLIAKRSDAVMVVGTKAKEYLISLGAKESRIFITPYAALKYPINKFDISLPAEKQIILYLSRIVSYKGLDYLVKAFSKLENEKKDVFLLIAGNGPFKQEIKNLISKLKIKNFLFLDKRINNDEKGYLYSISDVFVLPSTFNDYDADCWGIVLNEAMSYGKPVISTDATGSARDLIKQGINGYMVKQKNVEELYSALNIILSDKKLKEKMGKESKRTIEESFNYENMSRGFIEAINKITSF